jgi:hypothetical protein
METVQPRYETLPTESFSGKNMFIIVLIALLGLSMIGINLLDIASNIIKTVISIFGPLITQILSILGYTTGTVINKTADIVSDTTKAGIDIAEGTVQNVGDLLISASRGGVDTKAQKQLDSAINNSNKTDTEPEPDTTENPIQNPIAKGKGGWCLIGEYENRRGCIEVSDDNKCMSAQVFPTQKMCLNPAQGA